MSRDPASDQLNEYKKKVKEPGKLLTGNGAPIANKISSLTVGPQGPMLMQDFVFIDEMSHFNQERIPERVVHARGSGAFGYFEVTHDITEYTKANLFSKIGQKTPILVRVSTVSGENGSAETIRNVRGFAIKFYTNQGIWDLVGGNMPIFWFEDPIMFPSVIHIQKRNPVTHLSDMDMYWDFMSLRPETTHNILMLYSDRGTPDGYRHVHGYGVNIFKLVNDKNEIHYARFHYRTDQGIKNLTPEKAAELTAKDPDYATRDLYNAIARGEQPSWSFYVQIMTPSQAESYRYNPFEVTKVWSQKEFPLIPVGKLVLDKNPENYFTDVEMAAFNPGNMPPGIQPSPDKILQGRMFSYGDTHRYRLGPNHLQLPVNCPFKNMSIFNYQRDGAMATINQDGAPNYFPNSFNGPVEDPSAKEPAYHVSGVVDRHEQAKGDIFDQATIFWRDVLDAGAKARLVKNLVSDLKRASTFIVERNVRNFTNVSVELGRRLTDELRKAGVPVNQSGKSANL